MGATPLPPQQEPFRMIQVSYVSRTREPMSADQLLALLLQCRDNNAATGVTGMLLFGNGTFLQAIEGEDAVVDALIGRILKDPRHADIQLLGRKQVDHRQYAEWSMGFERVTDASLQEIEGLRDFGAADFNFDNLLRNEPVVEKLMDHFREPHWDPLIRELDAKDKVIAHLRQGLVQARGRVEIATLVIESVTAAARKGPLGAPLVQLCESALGALQPRQDAPAAPKAAGKPVG
jgi:hypothetical protein